MKVLQIAFSPNGILYAVGDDGNVYAWNSNINDWVVIGK